jgi:hypothetical protein
MYWLKSKAGRKIVPNKAKKQPILPEKRLWGRGKLPGLPYNRITQNTIAAGSEVLL